MDSALEKLKKHPIVTHTQDILDLCQPLHQFNISTFTHVRVNDDQSFSCMSTNPTFTENYLKKKHYNADVHAEKNHCHLPDCLMWDNIDARGQTAQMLQDAADFQYKHIFTIIKKQESQVNYYHFGTHLNNQAINQMYINQFDLLEQFIKYFNSSVQNTPSLAAAYGIAIQLDEPKRVFTENDRLLLQALLTQRSRFLNDLVIKTIHTEKNIHTDTSQLLQLTPRELNCIPLLLEGYTAKEIAAQHRLSYRTVEGYIEILKKKLHARNKAELISKLWSFYQALLGANTLD